MASYTLNQELNGIEISFDKKPDNDTLTALKKQGFRWHRVKKVWYAKQTAERLKLAKCITDRGISFDDFAEAYDILTTPKVDRQKELKEVYRQYISEYWKDAKMIDHCMKTAAYIVELENGDITEIDKPNIETSFCFGYGMNGVSYEGDYEEAAETMRAAEKSTEYFISENMRGLNDYIETLKDESIRAYKYVHYCGNCNIHLKGIGFYRYYEAPASNLKDCKELTADERASLLAGYEEVKKAFKKRLDTYLKKYGLSKLHTWTYLRD